MKERFGLATLIALGATLLLYPAFRMAVAYLDFFPAQGAAQWWTLWGVMLAGHWLCAGIVFAALAMERRGLSSIGLDGDFLMRRAPLLVLIVAAAVAIAFAAPAMHYGADLPERMQSHPLGPVTTAQRLFWIAMAVTAGVVEEIVYRGYALTRLRAFAGLPLAVIVSLASFALMHGPSVFLPPLLALYLVSGALFTAAFLLLKSRRLELLILVHIGIDLALVAAP